jgi:hypothetical protein
MRGVINTTLLRALLLEVGTGGLRLLNVIGQHRHVFTWGADQRGDPPHYKPFVCGGGPHLQLGRLKESGAHYNPLVCGGGPHYQSSAPRDSGAYYNPLVSGEGYGLLGVIFVAACGGFEGLHHPQSSMDLGSSMRSGSLQPPILVPGGEIALI